MAEYICDIKTRCTEYGQLTDYERRERIVRCCDCSLYAEEDEECMRDPHHGGRGWYMLPDDFCSCGRERDHD